MDETLKRWLKSGAYLPDCLKDFHDQKNVFKRLDEMADRHEWINGKPDWITLQIYTIDVFLYFMAAHGYTLQRSRLPEEKRPPFCDLKATIDEYQKRELTLLREQIQARVTR